GRYAHNNDQSAHLVVLRDTRSTLIVRQVRSRPDSEDIYETRTWYRWFQDSYIIHSSQTRCWRLDEEPRILQEQQFFRSAEAFQQEAPTFFPFITRSPEQPTMTEITEEIPRSDS
ncbi:MAG: hypothetical protein HN348_21360, partial [Proteobacteria bacterium]|nr:hypothetical protein [Pseudomonadota bacterium]